MARAYTPPYGNNRPGRPRVMSVAELERRYGPNAQVELRSAPVNPYGVTSRYEDPGAYDLYEEDPVELPVKKSPWLPVVIVLMLGIGAFLGFALYRQGLIPTRLVPGRVALLPTDSLPVTDTLSPPPALPRLSSGNLQSTVSSSIPAENAGSASGNESAPGTSENAPTNEASEEINVVNPKPAPAAASETPAVKRAASRAQRRNADEAATLEAIRRERERLDRANEPSTEKREPSDSTESNPPGYIEAETPSSP